MLTHGNIVINALGHVAMLQVSQAQSRPTRPNAGLLSTDGRFRFAASAVLTTAWRDI
jgi:hypothetical protein